MSEVPFFVVHRSQDETVRLTPHGALKLLEAEVVILEDPGQDYKHIIKGRELIEAIAGGTTVRDVKMLHVRVDSTTDDPERMVAAVEMITAKNPTGRPPYLLPIEEED